MTGKAVMLDEIINYVQSLQRQVEVKTWMILILLFEFELCVSDSVYSIMFQFLSMKLATVNPRLEFNMENFIAKDVSATKIYIINILKSVENSQLTLFVVCLWISRHILWFIH